MVSYLISYYGYRWLLELLGVVATRVVVTTSTYYSEYWIEKSIAKYPAMIPQTRRHRLQQTTSSDKPY